MKKKITLLLLSIVLLQFEVFADIDFNGIGKVAGRAIGHSTKDKEIKFRWHEYAMDDKFPAIRIGIASGYTDKDVIDFMSEEKFVITSGTLEDIEDGIKFIYERKGKKWTSTRVLGLQAYQANSDIGIMFEGGEIAEERVYYKEYVFQHGNDRVFVHFATESNDLMEAHLELERCKPRVEELLVIEGNQIQSSRQDHH